MTDAAATTHTRRDAEIGLFYGLFAYLWWGFIPIYFKLVAQVPPLLVLSHRVVWSFSLLAVVALATRRWGEILACLRNRRVLLTLAASTILLAGNWGGFIWAVATNRVMQSSLGYFINPLVTIALGVLLLKERLRKLQIVGLILALIGVAMITIAQGQLPMIALMVAFSFGGYGLVRKLTHVPPLPGLTIETGLLLPLAIAYFWHARSTAGSLDRSTNEILMLAGIVTATPLLAFAAAMRRLKLSTMGFLQYLVPTCQFLLAVFAYHEPLDRSKLTGFICIWVALIICAIDSLRAYHAPVEAAAIAEI